MACRITELGYFTLYKVRFKKACIVFRTYAFEHHTKEIVISLENALCHRESLCISHSLDAVDGFRQTVIHADGMLCATTIGHHVMYLDMTAEAHHLVTDAVLET